MLAYIDLVSDVASTDIVYCTNDHVLVGFLKMHLIITVVGQFTSHIILKLRMKRI